MNANVPKTLAREVDGASEFVVDTGHIPLLITTWFGSPTVRLANAYAEWFASYVERSRVAGRRFVILDDATRAERPAPPVRGRLSKISCAPDVVIDRVVVVGSAAIRGALTAMSWTTGNTIKTTPSIEEGVRDALALLDTAEIPRPREFEYRPIQPS